MTGRICIHTPQLSEIRPLELIYVEMGAFLIVYLIKRLGMNGGEWKGGMFFLAGFFLITVRGLLGW